MKLSLTKNELKQYIAVQLTHFFPDSYAFKGNDVDAALQLALDRTEYCFRNISVAQYQTENGDANFYHLHSDQYSQFLYYLSNSLWNISQNKTLCDKLIYLNKILSGMFFSYKGKLPDIFVFVHPVGSIIGNASYSDYLVILQNVTVNTSWEEDGSPAPKLGRGLFLGAGAKIIGNKPIGDRVSLGADSVVNQQEIPDDSVVIRQPDGHIVVRPCQKDTCNAQYYFSTPIA